jgi:hypothetical protein
MTKKQKKSKNFRRSPEIVGKPLLNMLADGLRRVQSSRILVDFPVYFTYPVMTGSIKAYSIQSIWFSI